MWYFGGDCGLDFVGEFGGDLGLDCVAKIYENRSFQRGHKSG